jgi:uncharacterized protein with ParB-like and HNH nuclease domain
MQYDEGDIEKPELQRKYVWSKKLASRFIESLLLGLPVPSIFLANRNSGIRLIIDGYQRISTLYNFIQKGIWIPDGSEFRLINSTLINERWRDKTFKDLPENDQRRLKNYTIHAIIFEQKRPLDDSALFQIFERINTGGVTLNNQEVRNCVYQGAMNTLLFELNENKKWRALFGNEQADTRMLDLELILRFFALNNSSIYMSDQKNFVLKKLLNDEMSSHIKSSDYIEQERNDFNRVIEFIYDHFGVEAFFNLQSDLSKIRKKLYPTVYDSLMIATSIALTRGYHYEGEDLNIKRLSLLKNEEYRECITQGTMQVTHIRRRIGLALLTIYNMNL